MTALGLIGAVVPLMPTTIFLILAVSCFARSSPKLEAWLLHHPRFGRALRAWRDHRAMPRRAKICACTSMLIGFAIFAIAASPEPWLLGLTGALLGLTALWIATRPSDGALQVRQA